VNRIPARFGDADVHSVAHERVGEREAIHERGNLNQQPGFDELVDRVRHDGMRQARHRLHDVERELATEHRGHLQDDARVVGDAVDGSGDQVPDSARCCAGDPCFELRAVAGRLLREVRNKAWMKNGFPSVASRIFVATSTTAAA